MDYSHFKVNSLKVLHKCHIHKSEAAVRSKRPQTLASKTKRFNLACESLAKSKLFVNLSLRYSVQNETDTEYENTPLATATMEQCWGIIVTTLTEFLLCLWARCHVSLFYTLQHLFKHETDGHNLFCFWRHRSDFCLTWRG